ncbi:MAG: YqeG family HAD IIIA-type phosphatase [Candidatus Howiella sp.]
MSFLQPDFLFFRLTEITPDFLRKQGIAALALDVDNTLSTHHGQQPLEGLADWIANMQKNGIKLILMSNAFRKRVEPFAKTVGLAFQSVSLKPLPGGYFHIARRLGVRRRALAIVGDQFFTDVLGGKLSGVRTILVTPIAPDKFVRRRKFEARFIKNRPTKEE